MPKTYNSPKDLYVDFPEIADIADRLELSVKEVSDYERKKKDDPTTAGKEVLAEKAGVIGYYKDKKYNKWILKPVGKKEEFEAQIEKCLLTRSPDCLVIGMFIGGRTSPKDTFKFWINGKSDEENAEAEKEATPEFDAEAFKEKITTDFNEKLAGLTEQHSKGGDLQHQITLMKITFDNQLKDMAHKQEIEKLKAAHEKEVEDLMRQIDEKNDEILDLEEDLKEAEGELGTTQEELAKKKEPNAITDVLGDVFKKGLAGFLKSYPKITESMTGLDEQAQAKLWIEAEKRLSIEDEKKAEGSESSFSEAGNSGIDFTGVEEKQVEGIKMLIEFMKQLDFVSFQKVYYFFTLIIDDNNGELNPIYLDQTYAFLNNLAKSREEKEETPA